MSILITGISGCIGESLAAQLLTQNETILGLDLNVSSCQLEIPLHTCDITHSAQVDQLLSQIKPDIIVHCAGIMGDEDLQHLINVNAKGTQNIINAAIANNVKRLVHLSSVAVISGNSELPLTDDMPYSSIDDYGVSKIEAEKLVIANRDQLPAVILRPAIIYGENEQRVLKPFMKAIENKKLPIMDIPEMNSRLQLAFVDNLVQALVLAIHSENALSGTFIIADDQQISLKELFEIAYRALNIKAPVLGPWMAKKIMNNPKVRNKIKGLFKEAIYDISQAKDILGYQPQFSTTEALTKSIQAQYQQPLSKDSGA